MKEDKKDNEGWRGYMSKTGIKLWGRKDRHFFSQSRGDKKRKTILMWIKGKTEIVKDKVTPEEQGRKDKREWYSNSCSVVVYFL